MTRRNVSRMCGSDLHSSMLLTHTCTGTCELVSGLLSTICGAYMRREFLHADDRVPDCHVSRARGLPREHECPSRTPSLELATIGRRPAMRRHVAATSRHQVVVNEVTYPCLKYVIVQFPSCVAHCPEHRCTWRSLVGGPVGGASDRCVRHQYEGHPPQGFH